MITTINKENCMQFKGLLPVEELEKVLLNKKFGLGAISDNNNEYEAVGTLVFSTGLWDTYEGEILAVMIDWFYIGKDFRMRGAADELMSGFFEIMRKSGVEHILCDIPADVDYNLLCAYLEESGFEFIFTDKYEVNVTLEDVMNKPLLSPAAIKNVNSLSDVDEKAFNAFLDKLIEKKMMPAEFEMEKQYYDQDISCFECSNGSIDGMLLLHVNTGKILELELLRSLNGNVSGVAEMMSFAVHEASKRYPADIFIRYKCHDIISCQVTEKMFPKQHPKAVRRGYLSVSDHYSEER